VAVLDRSRPSFVLEYMQGTALADRWFAMSVVPLNRPEGGAVVTHTDVTERKRVELEAQRSRQELAHFTRVSTMGELTASLAHELNQPLTGILANAQAARRFLDATPPDLTEVHEILSDIIEDDKRAAEVIRRLRDMLRKGESQQLPLDLNTLIRDVAKLVSSDAVIRNVAVTLVLDADLPIVSVDRIQLEQVVLNLLINGMESMGEDAGDERPLFVRTERTETKGVHVSVRDAGSGLHAGTQDLVFEPFYTTKSAGMGMGLAIARSIIEAHGGNIWAENNAVRGATFHFTLPGNGEPMQ
jgi:two-component system, LuxR family, sensor kinase FixL